MENNRKRVLYIKANPKEVKDSISLTVGQEFIEAYKKANPNDEVVELNLYKSDIKHIGLDDLANYANPEGLLQRYSKDFASFDKYVFATPMWNLFVPSILKTYIDHIVVSGVTFKYSESGMPKGLLKDKKAVCILSRGGAYSFWPLSMFAYDSKYLKTILGFMGIKDREILAVENTGKHPDKRAEIVNKAIDKAKKLAMKF